MPNFLHSKIAVAAAEAGKHVLVEKPMAITVKECDDMIAAGENIDCLLWGVREVRDEGGLPF